MNEIAQIVTVEISIRMHWFDPRLRLSSAILDELGEDEEYASLNPRLAKNLWIPDIFIDEAKELREPTFHVLPASLRVYRYRKSFCFSSSSSFETACTENNLIRRAALHGRAHKPTHTSWKEKILESAPETRRERKQSNASSSHLLY